MSTHAQEEAISIPLQTLAIAIFDATLVYMLNRVGHDQWQPLRYRYVYT